MKYLLPLLLLTAGCATHLDKHTVDILSEQVTLRIAEDSPTDYLCLQFYTKTSQTEYQWKCIPIKVLREQLFPEVPKEWIR